MKFHHTLTKLTIGLILLSPTLLYITVASTNQLVRLFPDDAFYYLTIAHNTIHKNIVSFDGIIPTNGFHPLQLLLSSFMALFDNKVMMLRLAVLENAILVITSSIIIAGNLFKDISQKQRLLGIALLAFPGWYLYIWIGAGMETGLVLLFGAYFYCLWEKAYLADFSSTRLSCWLSLVASLLILSRLDTAIALLPFAGYYLWVTPRNRKAIGHILLPGLTAASLLLPYLAWNYFYYDHFVPISGIVKSTTQHDLLANWRALTSGGLIGTIILFFPLVVSLLAIATLKNKKLFLCFLIFILSTALYYIYILFFAKQVFRWYLAFPLTLQIISVAILYRSLIEKERLSSLLNKKLSVVGLVILCVSLHGALYKWTTGISTASLHLKLIADDLNRTLTKNSVLAVYDAGVIGFFCNARVVNLDGLVNSYEYYKSYYLPARYEEYFKSIGVTHFLVRQSLMQKNKDNQNIHTFIYDKDVQFAQRQILKEYDVNQQFSLRLYKR